MIAVFEFYVGCWRDAPIATAFVTMFALNGLSAIASGFKHH